MNPKEIEIFYHELPDGTHIIVKGKRIRWSEALFKSSLKLYRKMNSILKYKIIRNRFIQVFALSIGILIYNGLPERFTKEIKTLAPE